jgi:hypothetical protein
LFFWLKFRAENWVILKILSLIAANKAVTTAVEPPAAGYCWQAELPAFKQT